MTPFELSVRIFLQIAVILAACRIVGRLVRPFGQPQVVAEMITGVLLGPSLLGLLAPGFQAWLFPAPTKPVIYVLAQVGLALYMFLVGLEFDLDLIRHRMRSAVAVSWAGIAVYQLHRRGTRGAAVRPGARWGSGAHRGLQRPRPVEGRSEVRVRAASCADACRGS